MSKSTFKMSGYSYPGTSPLKNEPGPPDHKHPHPTEEKTELTKEEMKKLKISEKKQKTIKYFKGNQSGTISSQEDVESI